MKKNPIELINEMCRQFLRDIIKTDKPLANLTERNGCINKIRDTKGRHYNRYGRKGLIMTSVLSMLLRRKE